MTSQQIAAQAALHAIGQILERWDLDPAWYGPSDEPIARLMLAAQHLVRCQASTPADELCPVCRRATGEQVPQTLGAEIRAMQYAGYGATGRMAAARVVRASRAHLGLE